MTRRRRHSLTATGIVALAVVALLGVAQLSGVPVAKTGSSISGGELPSALERHLAVKRAMPGYGGMATEGPGSASEAALAALAYPGDTVTVAQMDRTKAAATKAFTLNKAKKGTWTNVGPSEALYPFTELRDSFNYVPNAYVAGGRTTSMVISHFCTWFLCPAWVTPAGGGVWRTLNIRAETPQWTYLGGPLGINAAGAISVDPNDPTGLTIYVGTGEANVCGSGCVAGVGLYKSTNGGTTWTGPIGKAALGGKGIGQIVVKKGDKKTIYVGTTTALGGMSSVCCTGVTRPVPDAAKWGLYKSADGGATWSFVHNGTANPADCTGSGPEFLNQAACSPRGVRHVALDPSNQDIVYASSYARGIWRSPDSGATWTQVKPSLNATVITTRAAFAVAALPNGKTRMYVHEGNSGQQYSRLSRSDDVATGAPAFTDLTSPNVADPGYAWFGMCGGQCWYDLFVHSPKGHPDMVYAGGAYMYGETIANKRAVVLSTDAGVSGTDMTFDATDPLHPNGLHPDQHDLVVNPANPFQFFETSDGGIVRSSGTFTDRSAWCDDPRRGLSGDSLARCKQMLSRIPTKLDGVNKGLTTLQFMSLSVSPHDSDLLQGGTQDNGTWESNGDHVTWKNTMIGDGGQSGFDAVRPEVRFHNFFDASTEINFNNGNTADWLFLADPIFGHAGTQFYAPVISDPVVSGTLFAGTGRTAYRTKTFGLGTRSLEENNRICNTWTGTFEDVCGDWAELGPTRLTNVAWGDRMGGAVAAIERTKADTTTAWAATTTGRVFISRNVDAADPAAVTWSRLDNATTPNRFVSSIYVDPANGNRAWVSYNGFSQNTPTTPGHVFEVVYNPGTGSATWTDLSHDLGEIPVTDLVRDDVTGDLYASNDYGVLRLAAGSNTWAEAATGMPNVEVAGLTILPEKRILYAASHGLGAWRLKLG